MPREIKMPKLSDTMEEGTLNVWRKSEGDAVKKGDVLVEVETDKADMEFEAYSAGTLAKILVPAGETVPVGTPIAVLRLEGESDADIAAFLSERGAAPATAPASAETKAEKPETSEKLAPPAATPTARPLEVPAPGAAPARPPAHPAALQVTAPSPRTAAPAPEPGISLPVSPIQSTSKIPFFVPDPDRVRATPRARVLAREKNVDLSEIIGSGPSGAVLVADVERYLEHLEKSEEPLLEGDIHATPVALRIAEEMKIDIGRVKGTGPAGRVTKRDLRNFLEQEEKGRPARAGELYGDEVKLSQKRKYLIRNMMESKRTAPHFYLTMDVDVQPLQRLREELKARGKHITYTHLILKASALALEHFPDVNATYQNERILRFNPINIALAVDVQGELVAPVVKDCQGVEIEALAEAADVLIRKAREKKLQPGDYADGSFTISNLGMFGVDHFYAIITPPQSTVLSVGSMREMPVVRGGEVTVGLRMSFGLAVDHRVLDGAKAAQFLAELRRILEHPEELLGSAVGHGN